MVLRVMVDMVVIKTIPLGSERCKMLTNCGFLHNVRSLERSGNVPNLPTFLLLAYVAIVLTFRPHFCFLPDMGTPQDSTEYVAMLPTCWSGFCFLPDVGTAKTTDVMHPLCPHVGHVLI